MMMTTRADGHAVDVMALDRRGLWLEMLLVIGGGVALYVLFSLTGFFVSGPAAVLISAGLVWWVCRRRGGGLALIGMGRPRRWWLTALLSVGVVVGAGIVVNVIVAPLAYGLTGEEADTSALDGVRGNPGLFLFMLLISWSTAAFGEEIIFRGFLMTWLRRAIGRADGGGGGWAWGVALVVQAAFFGLAHSYQGVAGMILIFGMGLVLGGAYLLVKRDLWVVILAHGLTDTLAMTLLYLDLLP